MARGGSPAGRSVAGRAAACRRGRVLWCVLAAVCAALVAPSRAAVSVSDDTGERVTLAEPARRVVSLAPHATEMLFAVGAGERVVGVGSYSDYPPEARGLPRVGSYDAVDYEAILALQPDLVLAWRSGNGPEAIERLRALGLTLYASEPRHLADIPRTLQRLGRLTGNAEQGRAAAAAFRERRARLRSRYSERPSVPVFFQIWHGPMMTVNGEHLISRLLRLCGGRNVFAELPALTPTVGVEAVLAADPEAIVTAGAGAGPPDWLARWKQWPGLTAARRGNLFHVHADLVHRAGPRVLQGAERICRGLEGARERRPAVN